MRTPRTGVGTLPVRGAGGGDPTGTVDLLAIAEGLAHSAPSWPGMASPTERCWRTVAATDLFEAFVIAWPVGGAIDLHDHGGAAGAVVVAAGELVETTVRPGRDGTLDVRSSRLPTGGTLVFGPGHVHDIVNRGPGPALSVHVYSPALTSMTFFDIADHHRLVPVRTEDYDSAAVGA